MIDSLAARIEVVERFMRVIETRPWSEMVAIPFYEADPYFGAEQSVRTGIALGPAELQDYFEKAERRIDEMPMGDDLRHLAKAAVAGLLVRYNATIDGGSYDLSFREVYEPFESLARLRLIDPRR